MPFSPLCVFSHLRWNFVYQRPQHLLSRLAASRRVLFVEEPIHDPRRPPHWELSRPVENLTVCRPHTPVADGGFHDQQMPMLRKLLAGLLDEKRITRSVAWFYTPMALPLLSILDPVAVVYDCMDDLASFASAPRQLLDRERQLLAQADLVFTGGPSLYEARRDLHPNVHCLPSSVDADHFAQARPGRSGRRFEAPEQTSLPHPRLGYYGVIDERLDLSLIDELARRRPEWQILMVGPIAKIDLHALPRASNIHYFGQQPYEQLPRFLAGWDVCLLPFARSDATRYISPTKTLEYMAAERQIVSTPIADVANPYRDIVYLGDSHDDFLHACQRAVTAGPTERSVRVAKMREVLAKTSWDATGRKMDQQIELAIQRRRKTSSAPPAAAPPSPQPQSAAIDGSAPPVVVIGAGPTGLSAAYHLGRDALLIERNDSVGGWCRSIEVEGFTFDWAGHIMFSNDPYVHEMYERLLGDNVHWQDREAWIYSKNVYTRYPFQGSLHGLPPDVIKECLVGAIEARFGSLEAYAEGNGSANGNGKANGAASHAGGNGHAGGPKNGHAGNGAVGAACNGVNDCCADGILESTARLAAGPAAGHGNGKPRNFEEFIYQVWGRGIARHFAVPYNRKLWAVDLKEVETSWLGGRVPMPDLEEMIEGALKPSPKPMGPNARFGYPLRGGFQALMNAFVPLLQGPLWLNRSVVAVSPERHTVTLNDGTAVPYERLISTMPLPALIRSMGEEAPEEVRDAAAALRHVSVRCVHLGIGRENLTEKHWIYYPEDTVFHRIFVQGNASPHCNPPGGFGLTCEITYSPNKPLPCDGHELIERCVDDCQRVGIFNVDDPIWAATQVDLPYAYVVYDHDRPRHVALIRQWLEAHDVILAGRYSEWEYYNSDHAFLAGKKAAQHCAQAPAPVAVA